MRSTRALVGLSLLCLLLTFYPAAASAAGGPYTVKPGDTLAKLAAANGTTIQALIQANGIPNPDLIFTGQTLVIPGAAAVSAAPTMAPATLAGGPAAWAAGATASPTVAAVTAGATVSPTPAAPTAGVAASPTVAAVTVKPITSTAPPAASPAPVKPPAASPAPVKPPVPAPAGGTGFVVSISKQRCYLFRGGALTDVWPCSTGRSGWGTRTGAFAVQSKIPRAYGSRWGFWMPYWLGIYWAGPTENGIHGLPYDAKTGYKDWGNKIGTPISFGCIVLQDAAAQKIYNMAYIGMPVVIQY